MLGPDIAGSESGEGDKGPRHPSIQLAYKVLCIYKYETRRGMECHVQACGQGSHALSLLTAICLHMSTSPFNRQRARFL